MRSHLIVAAVLSGLALSSCGKGKPSAEPQPPVVAENTAPAATAAAAPASQPAAEPAPPENDDPFPYTAVLSCGMNGFENISLISCFAGDVGTEIEVTNGDKYAMYKAYNIPGDWQSTRRGVEFPLSRHFSIKMQNSSDDLILGLRIFDNSGKVVFQKQAAQYGVISVSN